MICGVCDADEDGPGNANRCGYACSCAVGAASAGVSQFSIPYHLLDYPKLLAMRSKESSGRR
jgi:hypothetical protein